MKYFTQTLTTDIHEAAVARYAGYQTRWLSNEKQWAIQNPSDLGALLADVHAGVQTIANAIAFLKIYEDMRVECGESAATKVVGAGVELLPITAPDPQGQTWTARNADTSTLLFYRGSPLVSADVEDGRVAFVFGSDADLPAAVSLFDQRKLRVEPHAWAKAARKMRDVMHAAKGYKPR